MTYQDFINREIATWGEDEIFGLLDRGYTPTLLTDGSGNVKWSWIMPLTNASRYATVEHGGGNPVVSPVSAGNRAFE